MSETELVKLADLLERFLKVEKAELTESERRAAMRLVNVADMMATERKHAPDGRGR